MTTAWTLVKSDSGTTLDTSQISLEACHNLLPGDLVKLWFESLKPGYEPEFMWVRVVQVFDPGKYSGVATNNPSINPNLPHMGELLLFEALHVFRAL
jgi:hypothetical protein